MSMKMKCPTCQRILTATPEMSGKTVQCPCGQRLQMPEIQAPIVADVVEPADDLDDYSLAPLPPQQNALDSRLNDPLAQAMNAAASAPTSRSQSSLGQTSSSGGGDDGAMGWVIWIGLILLINFLSYLFNWPFWIY